MRQINPYFEAVRRADKILGDGMKFRARWKRKQRDAIEYVNSMHRFRLMGNQDDLGEERVMTGREAKAQNELFMQNYRSEIQEEIDAGVKFGQTRSVLRRWKWVERVEQGKKQD